MNLRTALGKALFVTMLLTTFAQSHAQDIETLLMPGKVIEGHAEVEAECSSCHKSFNKNAQRRRHGMRSLHAKLRVPGWQVYIH